MSVFNAVDSIKLLKSCGCNSVYRDDNMCYLQRYLDASPRHQDLSHVPLELLEQIQLFYDNFFIGYDNINCYYERFWCHCGVPENFGTIKNWFAISQYTLENPCMINHLFIYNFEIVSLVNIKDLRVAISLDFNKKIRYFGSYGKYIKEKTAWSTCKLRGDSANDFSCYWAIKKGYITQPNFVLKNSIDSKSEISRSTNATPQIASKFEISRS